MDSHSPEIELVKSALEQDRFELWFQPIVHLISRKPEWYEGLLRLRTEDGKVLTPNHFLPHAEKVPELMAAIDGRVLELASKHLMNNDLPQISINISGESIADNRFGASLSRICHELPGEICSKLILELTETAMIRDLSIAQENCRTAHKLGIRLAMDDFGEAFSSMMILRELPFDIVKIHGSFALGLQNSDKCWLITDWMRRLAFDLGMPCVLEFLSSEELCQEAIKMDFTLGQGFHLGRPAPLSKVLR